MKTVIILLTLLGTKLNVYAQTVNVVEQGVLKNRDQTDRINAIIAENKGKTIYFPRGRYLVKHIRINNDIILKGDNAVISAIGVSDLQPILDLRKGNIVIKQLTIDGGAKRAIGVYIYNHNSTNNITIDSCVIKNIMGNRRAPGYGIQINRNIGVVRILNTTITGVNGPEDRIIGNRIGANRGVYINNVNNVVIAGCIFENIRGYEDGDGIQYYRWDDKDASQLVIRDNLFRNICKRAIKIQANNVSVSNNRIYAPRRSKASYAAISIYGSNNKVEDNMIDLYNAFCAIDISGSRFRSSSGNNTVSGNDIRISRFENIYFDSPILIRNARNSKIAGNHFNGDELNLDTGK